MKNFQVSIFLLSYTTARRAQPKVHVYRFHKRATPRCIILQLVNSCPHPVSGASCVPLSPSPSFFPLPFSSFLPSVAASCADVADRPRDAIRGPGEWDQDGGQVHSRLAALRMRLWHAPCYPPTLH